MYKQNNYQILSNVALTNDVYKMVLGGDTRYITAPGQFINIRLEGKFLRRPISVCDYDDKSITIICVAVGIALITAGIYFLKNPYMQTSEAVRGSIDGPTAVYFVKKQPAVGSVISCITGLI